MMAMPVCYISKNQREKMKISLLFHLSFFLFIKSTSDVGC